MLLLYLDIRIKMVHKSSMISINQTIIFVLVSTSLTSGLDCVPYDFRTVFIASINNLLSIFSTCFVHENDEITDLNI